MNENQNEYVDINAHDNYPDSEQKIEIPTMKVIPLKKICMTIGELPTSYLETMTYYEMLIWFIEYLRNNIIPTINNNSEAVQEVQAVVLALQNYINDYKDSIDSDVEELETYMNNYFENLDVQEEINNKLEQMLKDGVLEQIIEQFIQSSAIWCFDNVADMKLATNLVNGSYAKTLGYFEKNDGGESLYKIRTKTNDDVINDGNIIAINTNLVAELVINRTEINVAQFGVKGDGIYDDSIGIQKAIDYACSLVQNKTNTVNAFGGIVSVILPAKKLYIKTQINYKEAINLKGQNTESTLILNDNINYMIYIAKDSSISTNEETQIEGGMLSNIRFDGNARSFTCTSAIGMNGVDHMILEKLYFYGIKGKCIELKGVRESNFNEIFTRFSGIYGSGCIEIIENIGKDSSNLNFGNEWNIIYPFGHAIKFNDGEFQNINNVLIHGMFQNVINSLVDYFGVNDYNDTNNHYIELNNSNTSFTNLETIYVPDNSYNINATNCNHIAITNSWLRSHLSNQETHGDTKYSVNLSTNSNLYLNNVKCTMAYQDGDIFNVDSTSKVYGSIINTGESYLNTSIEDFHRTTNFTIEGEKVQPVRFGYGKALNYKTYNRDCRANMILGQSIPDDTLQTIQPDAMYIGTNVYRTRAVVGIPDDAYFVLPQVNGTMSYINHSIFFDSNNNLKVNIYNASTQSYETKTIQMQ